MADLVDCPHCDGGSTPADADYQTGQWCIVCLGKHKVLPEDAAAYTLAKMGEPEPTPAELFGQTITIAAKEIGEALTPAMKAMAAAANEIGRSVGAYARELDKQVEKARKRGPNV